MRVIFLAISILILLSCKEDKETVSQKVGQNFAFVIGDWKRVNEEDGKSTYEHWRSAETEGLRGSSYTLQDGDTIFKETLRIFKKDTSWTLRVSGVHETPVDFTITSKSNHSFIAENTENEFPSKISYNYENELLAAQVSGDAMDISFIYKKIQD